MIAQPQPEDLGGNEADTQAKVKAQLEDVRSGKMIMRRAGECEAHTGNYTANIQFQSSCRGKQRTLRSQSRQQIAKPLENGACEEEGNSKEQMTDIVGEIEVANVCAGLN